PSKKSLEGANVICRRSCVVADEDLALDIYPREHSDDAGQKVKDSCRLRLFLDCIHTSACFRFFDSLDERKSKRSAIAAEPNRCDYKSGGKKEPDPESRCGEKFPRGQLCQINRNAPVHLKIERSVAGAEEAILQHGEDVAGVERDLLKDADRKWR